MKRKKAQSSILDDVYIAAPCTVAWETMQGDERVRMCGGCNKNVYNLSDMTKKEAESFLRENGTAPCMRFFRRQDGTIITDDCPRGLRKLRDQGRALMRLAAGVMAGLMSASPAVAQSLENHLKARGGAVMMLPKESPKTTDTKKRPFILGMPGRVIQIKNEGYAVNGGLGPVIQSPPHIIESEADVNAVIKPVKVVKTVTGTVLNSVSTVKDKTEKAPVIIYGETPGTRQQDRDVDVPELEKPIASKGPLVQEGIDLEAGHNEPFVTEVSNTSVDKRALEPMNKAVAAVKAGNHDLAEFYYEQTLKIIEQQPVCDWAFKVRVEAELKKLQALH